MSSNHRGNTQPAIDQEEHAHIGGVPGKKIFNIDSDGNVLNFSGITVYQGSVITTSVYGNKDVINQDSSTYAINTIDYAHHEVHSGSHYYVQNWVDIPASGTVDFLFVTPNTTKWSHAKWDIGCEAEATLTLFEGATTAANGSAVTVWNNNRNSASTSGTLAFSTPSVTATGTQIYSAKGGSGRAIGGEAGREHELVAKQNTKYLFRLTNNDGTATRWLTYDFSWYEHTNKE